MSELELTRRRLLTLTVAAGAAAVLGCPLARAGAAIAFKRSGKGGHISNAAKKHNANRVYATAVAATLDPPHPGDKSKVVPISMSRDRYNTLFRNSRQVFDLRRDV